MNTTTNTPAQATCTITEKLNNIISGFKSDLVDLLESTSGGFGVATGEVIDCDLYRDRAKYLELLREAKVKLSECTRAINTTGELISKAHAADTNRAAELISVCAQPKTQTPPPTSIVKSQALNMRTQPTTKNNSSEGLTFIRVTSAAGIYARVVELAADVLADGNIYYIRHADQFAIRCGGLFLHGGIGIIYDKSGEPTRVKYCRYGVKCLRPDKCTWYHDPLEVLGVKECRNFTAGSFLYSSSSEARGCRRIGSKDRFDTDITQVSPEEIRDFNDHVAHEFF
jgi:hypothetical protein